MKIVYEEGELERLKEAHTKLQEKGRFMMFDHPDPDHIYGLTFKVTEPYLAEYLLIGLLHHRIEDFNLGVDIQSIDFSPFTRSNDVKEQLHEAIDKIIG